MWIACKNTTSRWSQWDWNVVTSHSPTAGWLMSAVDVKFMTSVTRRTWSTSGTDFITGWPSSMYHVQTALQVRQINYLFHSYSIQLGTDYKIGVRLCVSVCLCVCVCVRLRALSRSHSSSIFTKIGRDIKTPKGRTSSLGDQYRTTPSHILSHKTPYFRPRGP